MELDHIFIFTQEPEQVVNSLQEFGLAEGTANVHPGQGTACRRFFFQNAYLELVWVINQEEIKNPAIAKMRLWERSLHNYSDYCPFGLCFRNNNQVNNSSHLLFNNSWRYYSAFLPEGQFANIAANEEFPCEPMLFEIPFFQIAPRDYPLEKQQPLTHPKGFKEITSVTLTLSTTIKGLSASLKKVLHHNILHVLEGESYSVALEFDHGKTGKTQDFSHLIPLTIAW